MSPLKLVVSGPVGAGKTTFISSLSEIPVVETDELASEDIGKERTTVALDFGLLTLDGVPIHLFGTPGQERFDFVWDILWRGPWAWSSWWRGTAPGTFPRPGTFWNT
jgi:signal recognition particle receptor subunit beta